MMRFRDKLMRFFSGRYGIDSFGKFLMIVYFTAVLVNTVLSFFVHPIVYLSVRLIITLLLIYIIFRIMSRSVYKRMNENRKYMQAKSSFTGFFKLQRSKHRDRKTHVYKKCPECKAVLRLKRIKGTHRACCPRCSGSFDVRVK